MQKYNELIITKKDYVQQGKLRSKLSSTSARFFTAIMQNIGFKCCLSHLNNFFKNGSRKRYAAFWTGVYMCNNNGCVKFEIKIPNLNQKKDDFVKFECNISGKVNHEGKLSLVKERLFGTKRAEIILNFMKNGVEQTYNQMVANDEIGPISVNSSQVISVNEKQKAKDVLRKIKNESMNLALSRNVLDDARISKAILQGLDTVSSKVKGYIQAINDDPFGLMMMAELQV
jgi:hypothetical protein